MAWAKGPMPGSTPKADALKRHPGATCKREYYVHDITAYVVRGTNGKIIAAGQNAQIAWEKASCKKPV